MELMNDIWKKAQSDIKKIVLPEGDEERTLKASEIIAEKGLAQVVLVGDLETIKKNAEQLGVNLEKVEIVDPKTDDKRSEYVNAFYELRKHKGVDIEKAEAILNDPLFYANMMLKMDDVQGLVAGAVHTTGDTLKPGMQIIKTAPGINVVSSFFIMSIPNCEYGKDGLMLFADCAVNPNPTKEQLASIAISTADNAKGLAEVEPKVAMLSFSSMGSARHELVDKVNEATKIAKEARPDLAIDGELQLDAAIVPSVAAQKAPNSDVAGKANVLVFPDLQAGNIGYKLVQRLANAEAVGPICQGFAKPINDLSRGCSVDDIVNVVAVTAVQAQNCN
ncbi:phosphate acetyltransferase [Oceanirhabdus seepicola]|uniref:Phosphate acetyltransferase n=1 Tax=Oceanirhabdus seepicola TaxID=2828781 RepID=A0A9J6P4L1_9CLOT|nr:phosphate acetyltransferase [Oceanirhabdus seepicola]MCM1991078.1 phosphate acetyltransferase [Oceanirhabdus seepicola]